MADISLRAVGEKTGAAADIIFVHGLGGDGVETWMVRPEQQDSYWPQWVYQDFSGSQTPCSVWALDYPAAPTRWADGGVAMALPDRARSVLEFLVDKGIGKRPTIFIAHSLGGLLVKHTLRMGAQSPNPSHIQFAQRTRGVVFMGTPHRGSNLATLAEGLRVIGATDATRDLELYSPYLAELDGWYRDNVERLKISTLAFRENKKLSAFLKSFWVVDPTSADPNIPHCPTIAVDADHFEMCKLDGRGSFVYGHVKKFVTELLQSTPRAISQDLKMFLGGIAKDDETCLCVLSSFEDSVTKYASGSGSRRFHGRTVSAEDTSAAVYLCSLVSQARGGALPGLR
jgi:pimeloyl-ACP methyl ester carboxylesterase